MLNIGAGSNLSGALRPIRRRARTIVAVDPDTTVFENPLADERVLASLEDYAPDHRGEFDAAFSVFVLEHVADPDAFMAAAAAVLKPGGRFYGLTVNKLQYFGLTTWALSRMGVADRVLESIKGRELSHHHHFPTEYRLNSIRQISRVLESSGFCAVEFRCFDKSDMYAWYLPKQLRGASKVYTAAAYKIGAPNLMGHLTFCATRRSE